MQLPTPRGALTDHLFATLRHPGGLGELELTLADDEDDLQLALWVLQQLSFRRIDGVSPAWEEDLSFLDLRGTLETVIEARLRGALDLEPCAPADLVPRLERLVAEAEGPSLSRWVEEHATLDHLRELVVHRSSYQLQEADPHSFAIPRLAASVCKTALLELQLDEYGGHEPTEAHALLFAETMRALDLRPEAELDRIPAATLATNTLLSWLGRSRRLVGALLGHLAVFEMTSVEPMARYAAATRRLLPGGAGTRAARFYDVHVAADGLHSRIAVERLVAGFAEDHPDEVDAVLFGAAALLVVERAFAEHVLERWSRGETSLRAPLPGSALGGTCTLRAG